jgi:hypothetical protein
MAFATCRESAVDATDERALAELREALRDLHGARLDRMVLFGSRSRDDAQRDPQLAWRRPRATSAVRGAQSQRAAESPGQASPRTAPRTESYIGPSRPSSERTASRNF